MGTAAPIADLPRTMRPVLSRRGSGLAKVLAATTSSVAIRPVAGAPSPPGPKADLGDGTKGWHFDVTHNLSGVEATYALNTQALPSSLRWALHRPLRLASAGVDIVARRQRHRRRCDHHRPPGEATVVCVTLAPPFDSYVAQNVPNGTTSTASCAHRRSSQPDLDALHGLLWRLGQAPISMPRLRRLIPWPRASTTAPRASS